MANKLEKESQVHYLYQQPSNIPYELSVDEGDIARADDHYVDEDYHHAEDHYAEDHYAEDDENDLQVSLEFEDPEMEDLTFELPDIPGADVDEFDMSEIEVDEEESDSDKGELVAEEIGRWDWMKQGGLPNFLNWLLGMIDSVPRHNGKETAAIEKVIAYFEALNKEISKAMRMDFDDVIDHAKAEKAREQIENGLERLIERLELLKKNKFKRNKKKAHWAEEQGLIKHAQKATRINGISIVVPLFISRLARVLVNGTVSGGHDIEDMYEKLKDTYKLTLREEAELQQLLADMGYPIRQDRGFPPGTQVETYKSDNYDWAANYQG